MIWHLTKILLLEKINSHRRVVFLTQKGQRASLQAPTYNQASANDLECPGNLSHGKDNDYHVDCLTECALCYAENVETQSRLAHA